MEKEDLDELDPFGLPEDDEETEPRPGPLRPPRRKS